MKTARETLLTAIQNTKAGITPKSVPDDATRLNLLDALDDIGKHAADAIEEHAGSPYLIRYGYRNGSHLRAADFGTALNVACILAKVISAADEERPSICNTDRSDCNSDGLNELEREQCEAAGLDVTRP